MNTIKIHCPKEWQKAADYSRDNYDETFSKVMLRMMNFACQESVACVHIYKDHWNEYCFTFYIEREDGTCYLNGGIIFHGFPGSGYNTNGSVMIEPQYGWHTHT